MPVRSSSVPPRAAEARAVDHARGRVRLLDLPRRFEPARSMRLEERPHLGEALADLGRPGPAAVLEPRPEARGHRLAGGAARPRQDAPDAASSPAAAIRANGWPLVTRPATPRARCRNNQFSMVARTIATAAARSATRCSRNRGAACPRCRSEASRRRRANASGRPSHGGPGTVQGPRRHLRAARSCVPAGRPAPGCQPRPAWRSGGSSPVLRNSRVQRRVARLRLPARLIRALPIWAASM